MNKADSTHRWRKYYHWLLKCYPSAYRNHYEIPTLQLFDDLIRETRAHSPDAIHKTIIHIFLDTAANIVREQFDTLKKRLNLRKSAMKKSKLPFYTRHRALIITTSAVTMLSVASVITGFWGYNGPVGYLKRVITDGVAQEKLAASWNSGWDDVTANFVADYIQAKYYNDSRTDVGVNSLHAFKTSYVDHGKTYTHSLAETLNTAYAKTDPAFERITCSTQAPIAVHYVRSPSSAPFQANMIAAFSYAGQTEPNLVQYSLTLDQTKSAQGDWKISNITCLSLALHDTRPYTTGIEALRAKNQASLPADVKQKISTDKPYDQRNDRTFSRN